MTTRTAATIGALMTSVRPLVSIVDDDQAVREALADLVDELGFAPRSYASAEEVLAGNGVGRTSCLIVDIAMPALSGPDLLRELERRGHDIPIVFVTGLADETTRNRMLAL